MELTEKILATRKFFLIILLGPDHALSMILVMCPTVKIHQVLDPPQSI